MSVTFITSGTTWTVPSDWNNSNNSLECVGGGGSGSALNQVCPCNVLQGDGGGGGAYSKVVNQTYTASASRTVAVGSVAGDTSVKKDDNVTTAVLAKGGTTSVSGTPGVGGAAASGTGTTKFSGGNGGSGIGGLTGGGGGGAGGPSGNGSVGGNGTATVGGAGGNADSSVVSGPAGGTGNGANGNSGTEFDGTHGCGTGGAGDGSLGNTGGDGALYGGGGAGATLTPGVGKQGLIVITWTPASGASPFIPLDLSGHPPVRTTPETLLNRNLSLATFVQLQFNFVPYDFYRHPPTPPKGPEPLWPNLNTRTFVQLNPAFVPYDFYRHPPPPQPPREVNLNNLRALFATLVSPFVYYEFSHPPTPPKGPEPTWPNLHLGSFNAPVGRSMLRDAPPKVRGNPEWLAPNLIVGPFTTLYPQLVPYEFRHPPAPPKGPEFIFPNMVLFEISEVELPFSYYEFRHPPRPPKGPDTLWPNLHMSSFSVPVGARQLGDAPLVYRGHPEWFPSNQMLRFFPPTTFVVQVQPGQFVVFGSVVNVATGSKPQPPPTRVRDPWDRDEWGNLIPGAGYH